MPARYRELTDDESFEAVPAHEGVIAGGEEFARQHLAGVASSPEIPSAHVRPPRPSLAQILAGRSDGAALAAAYRYGYTMPAIANQLALHPSTVSRRLSRHRAQIKT